MIKIKKGLRITWIFLLQSIPVFCQEIALDNGDWYKIPIQETGVYSVDERFLRKHGIQTKNINPNFIRLFATSQKQLAQANANHIYGFMKEIPVECTDRDGKFDKNDKILFYAESPDLIYLDSSNQLSHKIHYYEKLSYIFLKIDNQESLKIQADLNSTNTAEEITQLTHFEYFEPEYVNLLTSGREWFGEYFGFSLNKKINIPGLVTETPIKIKSRILSNCYENTTLKVSANGDEIMQLPMKQINYRRNDNFLRYRRAGEYANDSTSFKSKSSSIDLKFELPPDLSAGSGAYFDYLEIEGKKSIPATVENSFSGYYLNTGLPKNLKFKLNDDKIRTWIIGNHLLINEAGKNENGFLNFTANSGLSKILLFSEKGILPPKDLVKVNAVNLLQMNVPELLIIHTVKLKDEAESLAQFRKTHDKLDAQTVDLESIYDYFSGGQKDPNAIRDFCRFLWLKEPTRFKYLLLLGDTSFDIKDNSGINFIDKSILIPTYESKESLEPIYSYSSDDYFGFLENHEGNWAEGYSENGIWYSNTSNDHSLDISVGRLPVKSLLEARQVINKLIRYGSTKETFGNWRNQITFIADDDDLNIHQLDAESFSSKASRLDSSIFVNKIYLDAYSQIKSPEGDRVPDGVKAFEKTINEGSLIINYNGHGSENGWTDEKLLTLGQITSWNNKFRLPVFFTATCEFGRYDDPYLVSGAELTLLNSRGGAAALMTTTRPVFSSTNYRINEAFYDALFNKNISKQTLGDIFKQTKNNSIQGEINRNFSLLGDPSMRLVEPLNEIELVSLNDKNPDSISFGPHEIVKIKGKTSNSNFNGSINIRVYDKPTSQTTYGSITYPKMNFNTLSNKIFEGNTEINNGEFEISFPIPPNLNSGLGNGKILFYAVNADSTSDISGGAKIRLSDKMDSLANIDVRGPQVELILKENNTFLFNISDESGINVTNYDIDGAIRMIINDTLKIDLSSYYLSSSDFRKGRIEYKYPNILNGNIKINFSASDTYNNKTDTSFSFFAEAEILKIFDKLIYPNPTKNLITIQLSHNRPGSDMEFETSIYDLSGKLQFQQQDLCNLCENETEIGMNVEQFLNNSGSFIYKIKVHEINSDKKVQTSGKLMFWK